MDTILINFIDSTHSPECFNLDRVTTIFEGNMRFFKTVRTDVTVALIVSLLANLTVFHKSDSSRFHCGRRTPHTLVISLIFQAIGNSSH